MLNAIFSDLEFWKVFLGPMITVAIALFSAWYIIRNSNNQIKANIKLQQNNYKKELEAEFYKKIVKSINRSQSASAKVSSYVYNLKINLENHFRTKEKIPNSILTQRTKEFMDIHNEAGNTLVNLIYIIENYEIVSPEGMELTRMAVGNAHYNLCNAFAKTFEPLLAVLPIDSPNGPLNVKELDASVIGFLNPILEEYLEAQGKADTFTYDLRVALQNLFLGDLYGHKIKLREPIDPKYHVFSFNDIQAQMKYYDSTPFGQSKKKAEEFVRSTLK